MFELTKPQKKIARKVIEKGLDKEYQVGINKVDRVIDRWKSGGAANRETYLKMYEVLTRYDKHIARRYNRMSGSNYLIIIAGQRCLCRGCDNGSDFSHSGPAGQGVYQ